MATLTPHDPLSPRAPTPGPDAGAALAGPGALRARPEAERAARAELRRQISRLEGELSELFGHAFPHHGIEFDVPGSGGPGRVLGLGELERVRDVLASRVGHVRAELDRLGEREAAARALIERMIEHPERYPWVRVSNAHIGEPGCRHWHSRPRLGLIGLLLGWWRVRVSSGCPLAGPLRGRRRGRS